jgi:inhibitor of KinA sporulation pathway (predicted exonuclease)
LDIKVNQGQNIKDLPFNESIEFSAIFLDVKLKKRVDEFHTYVKPTNQKKLHEYTIEKTGIQNQTIFAKETPNVYRCL